jgi:hypothetical protein
MSTKKQMAVRNYGFSDGELKQYGDEIINSIERDIVEFAERGMTTVRLNNLQQKLVNFDELPTDEILEGIKIDATQDKDTARNNAEIAARSIFVMAENKFGTDSGKYKQFGNAAFSRQSDNQFYRTLKTIKTSADKFLLDLAEEGLTQEMIDNLVKLTAFFDKAIDDQNTAIKSRDIATEERIEAGNALYADLVKVCNTGKDIWYNKNEAKYNDYVIYTSPTIKDNTTNPNDMPSE